MSFTITITENVITPEITITEVDNTVTLQPTVIQNGGDVEWGDITGTLSDQEDLQSDLDDKQDTLVSGTNIKTINGNSVLGTGDLPITEVEETNNNTGLSFWTGSQAEYDLLTPDANTLYIINA